MLGTVALPAGDPQVLAIQEIARFRVIKSRLRRLPVNDPEIQAIVLRMAADAPLVAGLVHQGSVVAAMGCDPLRDLRMTFQALDLGTATGEPMAHNAICGPAQPLVRA